MPSNIQNIAFQGSEIKSGVYKSPLPRTKAKQSVLSANTPTRSIPRNRNLDIDKSNLLTLTST